MQGQLKSIWRIAVFMFSSSQCPWKTGQEVDLHEVESIYARHTNYSKNFFLIIELQGQQCA